MFFIWYKIKKFIEFKYNLDLISTIFLIIIAIITLRSFYDSDQKFISLPYHFYEFNMYKYDIRSTSNFDLPTQDYVINKKHFFDSTELRKKIKSISIPATLNRWKIDISLVEDYFCKNIQKLVPNLTQEDLKEVEIKWIHNRTELKSKIVIVECK
jgi:hypothetical protein